MDLVSHTTRRGLLWILATEAAIGAWAVAASVAAGVPDGLSLRLFALLTGFAIIHMEATRPAEERRRAAHLGGEHIDHTGVWTCAGAFVLPVPLVVALVLIIRLRRYFIARKPPGRYVFTTLAITSSALATQAIATATPVHAWIRGADLPPDRVIAAGAAVLAAFAAYYTAQTAVIGVARGLRGDWQWRAILGDRKENADLVITLCLGLIAAWAAPVAFGLLLFALTAVVIGYTRHTQRIEHLEHERDRLEVDALHDPLTGLANQRGFNPAAALALVADQARRRPTAVMMFDLDRFKGVNDRLGHLGANEVLKALATVLRTTVRRDDLVCRWGGEEFTVLLPGTATVDAWATAERIRMAVEDMTVPLTKAAGGRTEIEAGFTISGGIALSPDHGTDLATLQERADFALAEAKDMGRNRIRIAPTPVHPTPLPTRQPAHDPH
ncbi:hypothetical protein BJP25_01380 [Actinokineospora bangkokensis]|uniref:GGDEF domain-containing protein n=1 Tax=Actinokineospora bangkokensis TaxID=1193682 RepID=A0A1Q9LE20_9PSEU|nr:hypothetical protein BJP25_01380 [Actinokineospora bangkokensis]